MAYKQRQEPPPRVAPRRSYSSAERVRPRPKPKPPAPKRYRRAQPPAGGLFSTKLVVAIFFVFVFVYIGHSIWAFWTPSVDTMIVRMSTVVDPQSVTGVIIRDERLFYAEKDGTVEFWVQDNERVRVNTLVASVANQSMTEVANRELANIEAQALSLQAIRNVAETESVVQRLNSNMNNAVNARIHSFTLLNLSDIYTLRDDLNRVINTRNQININEGVGARASLAREQELSLSILGIYSRNMYAGVSGIMSRAIDGWETNLTIASIGDMTPEIMREVVESDAMLPSQVVQEGDALFKIVGNVWYIAAYMPNNMIYGFTANTNRMVYLLNASTGAYEPHSLRIQSIEHGTRYSMVIFRNTRYVINFMNQRSISIRTASGIQQGLKIPDTAIITNRYFQIPIGFIHGETVNYVLISTETGNISVPVTIDSFTEYYALVPATYDLTVDSLFVPRDPYGSHMLLSHEHLREVHGVFQNILGVAEFREINLGEGGFSGGFVLLDPALNPRINEFASIVTDASTVTAGQLIK